MDTPTYLDNNADTLMPKEVFDAMEKFTNRGNSGGFHPGAIESHKVIEALKDYIRDLNDLGDAFDVIITSGATESNSQVIQGRIDQIMKGRRSLVAGSKGAYFDGMYRADPRDTFRDEGIQEYIGASKETFRSPTALELYGDKRREGFRSEPYHYREGFRPEPYHYRMDEAMRKHEIYSKFDSTDDDIRKGVTPGDSILSRLYHPYIKYETTKKPGYEEYLLAPLLGVPEYGAKDPKFVPHIITSAIEHKSIINTCKHLIDTGRAEVSYVYPDPVPTSPTYGMIVPEQVVKYVRPTTVIVSIMAANNETGIINPIEDISKAVKKINPGIMFHTDAVQYYGKTHFSPGEYIDAFSASFHKLHGPTGIGLLCVRKAFKVSAIVHGPQNEGLRGGTESAALSAGALKALRLAMRDRSEKNSKMSDLREELIQMLPSTGFYIMGIEEYYSSFHDVSSPYRRIPKIVVISGDVNSRDCIPNTLSISIPGVKNAVLCKALASNEVYVGIGSACNNASGKGSHVLEAMKLPPEIVHGAIRISMDEYTTDEDIRNLISTLASVLPDMLAKPVKYVPQPEKTVYQ